jgi:S1-C subfamily serine protease
MRWIASGFFYGSLIPSKPGSDEKKYLTFLVTNRHVLEGLTNAYIRVNPKERKAPTDYELELKNKTHQLWFAHPDPTVDVAVFPGSMGFFREQGMQIEFFPNDEVAAVRSKLSDLGVAEGDFVYVLGFPMGLVGEERNLAIVRQGVLARVSDALVNPNHNYLIDAFIFPGNSGGPVILKPELVHIGKAKPIPAPLLIGLVKEYIAYQDIAISAQTQRPRIVFEDNSGLAEVIPIDRVQECVDACLKSQPPEVLGI